MIKLFKQNQKLYIQHGTRKPRFITYFSLFNWEIKVCYGVKTQIIPIKNKDEVYIYSRSISERETQHRDK